MNPGNTWAKTRAINELSWLWNRKAQGKINRWRQVNLDFPDAKIRLSGPGKDSGTFDVFNKTLNR